MNSLGIATWAGFGRHALSPRTDHDESSRMEFTINLFRALNSIQGHHREIYEKKVEPEYRRKNQRAPKNRHEVRAAMLRDPTFQVWSHLRVHAQWQLFENARLSVDRQLDTLIDKARKTRRGRTKGTLRLDPTFTVPRYQQPFDMHWMPGSYFTEFAAKDDVAVGAMYDFGGLYVLTNGKLGQYNNGAGYSVVRYLREKFPGLNPKSILDQGCTVGHNTLPLKDAWPKAEVHGIDIGAPTLRYAHARAEDLGYAIHFSQQNAEQTNFKDNSFNLIVSTMFLHETSYKAVHGIVKENHRLLKPGGMLVHVEQPPFSSATSPFDAFTRDWDTHNNQEPFWGPMHDMDLEKVAVKGGFKSKNVFQEMTPLVTPVPGDNYALGDGRWFIFGAIK
ncbi:MAG: class I SAM-dependent methyltransferase [Alphaproteobacteria bacterium]|nr:class I SAM-dependent methyltransferase [Alphaproteobacteria bacterium]